MWPLSMPQGAPPQFGNGMLAELGEGSESCEHLCTHSLFLASNPPPTASYNV